jgi:hypothetical protein
MAKVCSVSGHPVPEKRYMCRCSINSGCSCEWCNGDDSVRADGSAIPDCDCSCDCRCDCCGYVSACCCEGKEEVKPMGKAVGKKTHDTCHCARVPARNGRVCECPYCNLTEDERADPKTPSDHKSCSCGCECVCPGCEETQECCCEEGDVKGCRCSAPKCCKRLMGSAKRQNTARKGRGVMAGRTTKQRAEVAKMALGREAKEAAYRLAADRIVALAKPAAAATLERLSGGKLTAEMANAFLGTPAGEAVLGMILSTVMLPAANYAVDGTAFDKVARLTSEMRTQAMFKGTRELSEMVMVPFQGVLTEALRALPEPPAVRELGAGDEQSEQESTEVRTRPRVRAATRA